MSFSIGVLSGMGPRSTAPFIDLIVTECQTQYGALYDIDFPEMHIISLPTPFYPDRSIDDIKMIDALKYGISSLVTAGVSLIVVPCNLAHKYYSEMQRASSGIPIIHIADAALKNIPKNVAKVAVIGTEPTLDSGIYQKRILKSGRDFISSHELRAHTTKIIKLVKEKGFESKEVIDCWSMLLSFANSLEIDVLLIACTDLSPLIGRTENNRFSIVDTSRSLAVSAVNAYCSREC